MAEYLMPNSENLTISEKRYIFSMHNRMIPLPHNFPSKDKYQKLNCICKHYENMEHVYTCSLWNQNKEETTYNMIFTDNIIQQTKVI